ncbi:MAG: hypothetical protein GY940_43455, partial [bacterium]|nr:hypothetical protein [bacterium]
MTDKEKEIQAARAPEASASAPPGNTAAGDSGSKLESGTYEIIKGRLDKQGKNLKTRLEKLNDARKDVFGSIENTLLGSERIITRNNCIPRDMVPVGDKFIFGYNVQMGLKSRMVPADVFAVYEYKEKNFKELDLTLL